MKNVHRFLYPLFLFLFGFILPARAQTDKWTLVATNNCGTESAQPFLVKGNNYKLPDTFSGSEEALTCNYGGTIIYAFDRMDIQADYRMEVVYLSDQEREQRIVVDGDELQSAITLEAGKEQRYAIELPKRAYAYGQLVLVFEALRGGSNAIVSAIRIYSSNPNPLVPFEGEEKLALSHTQPYHVDTTVNVESVMPLYTVKPYQVTGVYKPEISLNGTWLFNERPESGFYQLSEVAPEWKPIAVPGQWSMQGFKVDSAGFGGYRTTFRVPDDWNGKQVKLRFDGVSSECVVWLNGREVGDHMGGMTAFELDITSALVAGENRLALKVRNESLADMLGSLTQYAAHQLGGITRKVTLFAVPDVYISDMRIVTQLDRDYRDAELKVYLSVTNAAERSRSGLSARISIDGLPFTVAQSLPSLSPGESWNGWVSGKVENPAKWDNEHPNLYTLKVELAEGSLTTELIEKTFGFRQVEVQGNQLLVNGKAVKLRGVCRHEVHPLTGRVPDPDLSRKDAELYRLGNCNFIRTSHYPPAEEFIEACNELGLFVEVEAPVCWVGHHANENWRRLNYRDSIYYPYILQANMETVHFYRNHPSVIFWSVANESYWNAGFAQVLEYVKKADPTRPSAFHDQAYGGFNNQGSTAPIANIHYPGPNGYKAVADSERPMLYGEYCHLNVYNRSELVTDPGVRSDWALALAPAWENMYKTQAVLGGSIWSGIDDIFQLPDGEAVGYGPWGPIDGWRRPKPEYWDMKKIYSPVRVLTSQLQPGTPLEVELENRYTFTNFNELEIRWKYGEEQGVAFAEIQPGQSGRIGIPVNRPAAANELYLTFTDPRGFVTDEYRIPVGKQHQNELPAVPSIATRLKIQKDRYHISGKGFSGEVSRQTGQILSMKKEGRELLIGGPWLMALPLNGEGCFPDHNARTPLFNDICSDWKVSSTDARVENDIVCIEVNGSYKEFEGSYEIRINAGGEVTVTYLFTSLEDVNPRQWGLVFEAPRRFDRLSWRRDGMWSLYPADHISRSEGEAPLFYDGLPLEIDPAVKPAWSWSFDFNELGSNDFRSTRRNIWYAGLTAPDQSRVFVRSDGLQHWRSWLEKDRIRFLVADFVTAGNEMFLNSYYAPYRKPLKKGDPIEGKIMLHLY